MLRDVDEVRLNEVVGEHDHLSWECFLEYTVETCLFQDFMRHVGWGMPYLQKFAISHLAFTSPGTEVSKC